MQYSIAVNVYACLVCICIFKLTVWSITSHMNWTCCCFFFSYFFGFIALCSMSNCVAVVQFEWCRSEIIPKKNSINNNTNKSKNCFQINTESVHFHLIDMLKLCSRLIKKVLVPHCTFSFWFTGLKQSVIKINEHFPRSFTIYTLKHNQHSKCQINFDSVTFHFIKMRILWPHFEMCSVNLLNYIILILQSTNSVKIKPLSHWENVAYFFSFYLHAYEKKKTNQTKRKVFLRRNWAKCLL